MDEKREVFICYAHEDEPLRQSLEKHLRVLQRQDLITVWHDRKISPGTDWEKEIDTALNHAHIVLVLVSPDFMASDYCYSIEMKRALQRHEQGLAKVLPIILRPVHWQTTPLGKLQGLPTDARPIVSSSWHSQDEAFYSVAEGIRAAIKELATHPQFASSEKQTPPQKSIGQLQGEGEVFYAQEQYEEALAAFNQILLLEPENYFGHSWKGAVLYYLNRHEEALAAREKALQYGNFKEDHLGRAYDLYELQRYEEALAACEQAIRLDPAYTDAYIQKGKAFYSLKRYEEALAAFNQILLLEPENYFGHSWKGAVLYYLNRHEEALAAREKALQYGNFKEDHLGRAYDLYELQRYEEALVACEQAIRLDPAYTDAYSMKAKVISQQRKKKIP